MERPEIDLDHLFKLRLFVLDLLRDAETAATTVLRG
jgi:hypothetical protein